MPSVFFYRLFRRVSLYLLVWGVVTTTVVYSASSSDGMAEKSAQVPAKTFYQFSTITALFHGLYDGELSMKQALQHGDFGLGTLNGLDGELIIWKGKGYQVRDNGHVYDVPLTAKLPFVNVVAFHPEKMEQVHPSMDFAQLKDWLDTHVEQTNRPVAIEATAMCSALHTRSVARQAKPYPTLAEAVAHQVEFHLKGKKVTLVAFRVPQYLSNVSVAGYHVHGLTSDGRHGGHVLGLTCEQWSVAWQELDTFILDLPNQPGFDAMDFSQSVEFEIQHAESAPKTR